MAQDPTLIIQLPRGTAVDHQLHSQPPPSVASDDVVLQVGLTDPEGNLEPPVAGEVVLSLPSPEGLEREAEEVQRVIRQAGTGTEPLVVVIEAAEELREEELAPLLGAARRSLRPVILRIIREA